MYTSIAILGRQVIQAQERYGAVHDEAEDARRRLATCGKNCVAAEAKLAEALAEQFNGLADAPTMLKIDGRVYRVTLGNQAPGGRATAQLHPISILEVD